MNGAFMDEVQLDNFVTTDNIDKEVFELNSVSFFCS